MKKMSFVLVVLLFCVVPQVFAAPILSGGVLNYLEYHNYELAFDANGDQLDLTDPAIVARQIKEGDTFVGIMNIDNTSTGWLTSAAEEVTGVFAQTVTGVTQEQIGLVPTFHLEFNAVADANKNFTLLDGSSLNLSPYLATGEMMTMYRDTTGNFTQYGDLLTSFATAVDGDLWMSLGEVESTDYAYSHADIGQPLNLFSADAWMGLSVMQNNTGFAGFLLTQDFTELEKGGIAEVVMASAILRNDAYATGSSDWMLRSRDPAKLTPVPEPTTFLLLGAGLMGLGYFSRKRRS